MSEVYFGRPGALITIPHPRGGVDAHPDRPSSTFRTGTGGARVGRALRSRRQYVLSWDRLWYSTYVDLEGFHHGHHGPGPFALIDQSRINRLTVNQSGTSSLTNDGDGFTFTRVLDTFGREVADTDWGYSDNGVDTSTDGDGAVNMYRVTGKRGIIQNADADTTNIIIYENSIVDQDFTIYFEIPAVATGDAYDTMAACRWTDQDNHYRIELDVETDGFIYPELGKVVASVFSSLAVLGPIAYTSGMRVGMRIQAVGNLVRTKVWEAAAGQPEDWDAAVFDNSHTSGKQATRVQRNAANTNNDLEIGFYDVLVTHPGELSSDPVTINRGPRSLSIDYDQAGAGPTITVVEAASADWVGIPVIDLQQLTFSGYIRGKGTDVVMDVTAQMVWYDADRAVISTSSGTPVTTNSSTWQQVLVTATAPADAAYVQPRFSVANHGGSSEKAGLRLPGTSGHYGSTPDNAALDITGDLWLATDVTLDDWTPAAESSLIAKWVTGTNNRSYMLALLASGLLRFYWSTAGTAGTVLSADSTVAPTPDPNTRRVKVAASIDVDNGAAGRDIRFFQSYGQDVYDSVGVTVTQAGVTSIFSGAGTLEVGSHSGGTAALMAGVWHQAEVENSAGAQVANPYFNDQTGGATGFTDDAGRVWTINGASAIIRGYSHLLVDSLQLEAASAPSTWRPGTGIYPVQILNLTDSWSWQAQDYRESPVLLLQEVGT